MAKSAFRTALRDMVEQRHSKMHPFSEAWVTGGLNRQILGEWVTQHYHYVGHFSQWCGAIFANCQDEETNHFLVENIMEEEGFVEEGGLRERMTRARITERNRRRGSGQPARKRYT